MGEIEQNGFTLDDATLAAVLLGQKYLSQEDIERAKAVQHDRSISLRSALLESGLITRDVLGAALAEHLKVPYVDLDVFRPSKEVVRKIPETTAKKYSVVFIGETKGEFGFVSSGPTDPALHAALAKLFTGKKLSIGFAFPEDISNQFVAYREVLSKRIDAILARHERIAPEMVNEIIRDAVSLRASDIHFEPRVTGVVVRFRIDGALHEVGVLKEEHYALILNRMKILSKLRIDEHSATQDGAIRIEFENNESVDLRLSIAPIIEGEKCVLRVLAHYVEGFTLHDLGMSDAELDQLRQSFHKPFGMILVVGPTGSGKTTSLYSVLRELYRTDINITTIEDPVEYRMVGVNQIQVNAGRGITFGKGLRSIVRQDPDVILVGEIRDLETADISVNAALTGHLVLTTFHANDASTAIPRFVEMGIEPFLLASTLELIVAQRLVRKICDRCRVSQEISSTDMKKRYPTLASSIKGDDARLYRGKGCDVCGGTGFNGRTAIFEFIKMSPEMHDLILTHPSGREIWKLAQAQGSISLFADGVNKVLQGVTTPEELLRVAEPPFDQAPIVAWGRGRTATPKSE